MHQKDAAEREWERLMMLLSLWSEKKRNGREQMQPRNGTYITFREGKEECARKIEYEPAWQGCVLVAAKFSCRPRYDVSPGLDF